MVVFAAATLIGALFGDLVSLVLGGALSAVAWNELRGGRMLRRFEPAGAQLLGYNQIALGVMLVVYAAYSLVSALAHPMLASVGGSTGDAEMDAMIGRVSTMASYGIYGTLAVVGVIGPGLTALYYFTRKRLVQQMLEQTPDWVIQAMRAAN